MDRLVARIRKNWKDSQSSAICSKHFTAEDFERSLTSAQLPEFEGKFNEITMRLTCAVSTIHPPKQKQDLGPSSSTSPAKVAKPGRDCAHQQVGPIIKLKILSFFFVSRIT